ncbi:MAG: ribonuclease PH [bacterium]
MRIDARKPDEIRPMKLTPHIMKYAEGSVMVEQGETRVICTATVENRVPPHVKETGGGWVTAEYAMLPRSSKQRITRESMRGGPQGRTYEIQRLIGRSLRSVVNLQTMGERTIIVDCDVIQADGGTRTASVTGAFVALGLCLQKMIADKQLGKMVLRDYMAATSVGIVEGRPVLDLCYLEDAQAEVDMNVIMTGRGLIVEIQGTAEKSAFSEQQLGDLLNLARKGIGELIAVQKEILGVESFSP